LLTTNGPAKVVQRVPEVVCHIKGYSIDVHFLAQSALAPVVRDGFVVHLMSNFLQQEAAPDWTIISSIRQ
jgi:hypothetical protein